MKIGKYLTTSQIAYSSTALHHNVNNTIPAGIFPAVEITINKLYDPIRDQFPDIVLNSFYRCEILNVLLKGSKTSQHCKGEAIDINHPDAKSVFEWIRANLKFDQIVYEFGDDNQPEWIHVSYGKKLRGQILKSVKVHGQTQYLNF